MQFNTNPENTSKRTLEKDPQYFGAFLNMARHNVFIISNYLAAKFKPTNILDDDGKIKTSFLTDEIKDKPNHVYSHLTRLIPITKVFNTALLPVVEQKAEGFEQESIDFAKLATCIKDLFIELNEFRNDYSHYYSKHFIPTNIIRKKAIKPELADFLRLNFFTAIEYTKKRFEAVFENKHFNALTNEVLVDVDNMITQKGLVFFTCIFLEREYAFQFLSKIVGFKNTQTKEFLATREVFCAFCVKLPTDKFISSDDLQTTSLDMLNYLNRCPNELFDCLAPDFKKEFQPDLSASQQINVVANSTNDELPYENYDDYIKTITSKKRHTDRFAYFALQYLDNCESFKPEFQINLGKAILKSYPKIILGNEETREIVESIKVFGKLKSFYLNEFTTEEEKITEVRKMIRLKEEVSFVQYSPHYNLQENNKISISINAGTTFNKYYKTNRNTAQISVHDLPKIVLLEILQKGKVTDLINDFIGINKDKIFNLQFIEQIKNELAFEQPLYRKFHTNKVVDFDSEVYKNIDSEIASVKNILEDNKKLSIEDKKLLNEDLSSLYYWKYVENVENRKIKLDAVLTQHNLNTKQIPGRIVDYWLNIEITKNEITIKNIIKAEKKDCVKRIKDFANNKAPKIGEMATYLAKDIVANIIDENVKKKITGFYYGKLQECLALFANPEKKKLFLEICEKELNLFDEKSGHPFLSNLNFNAITKTTQFYNLYVTAKGTKTQEEKYYDRNKEQWKVKPKDVSWIYMTFYKKQKNEKTGKPETVILLSENMNNIPLTYKKLLQEKSNFTSWLHNLTVGIKRTEKDKPKPKVIDLPVNLFDAALVSLLKEKACIKADDTAVYNYSKLLEIWMKDTQPFYNGDREYIIYKDKPFESNIKFTPNTRPVFKDYFEKALKENITKQNSSRKMEKKQALTYFDVLKVFNSSITENEKVIRFYQTKDRVMQLMLNEILSAENTMHLQLKEISPTSEKSPLNQSVVIKQGITGKLSYDENGERVAKANDRKEITKAIIDSNRKRKDYGVFKKFISDKRLPELFEYFEEPEIEFSVLDNELKDYNRYKDLVFDEVFNLEKIIINSITNPQELADEILIGEFDNIQHDIYLDWLLKKQMISEADYIFLKTIRNAFSHNQFPPKVIVEKYITIEKSQQLTKLIFTLYKRKMEAIMIKF